MSDRHPFSPTLARWQGLALVGGGACLVVCVLIGLGWRQQFFSAYLFSYLFVLALALGSLGIVLLHNLTGGQWGLLIRRPAEAASLTLPGVAIFFLPILLGVWHLFPWAHEELVRDNRILRHQSVYLNTPMFALRALIYFVVWSLLAWVTARMSLRRDREVADPAFDRNVRRISAGGLVVYVITISLASVDWIMSREMHWYSSILGFILTVSCVLTAMVFLVALLRVLAAPAVAHGSSAGPLERVVTPQRLNDLGNLFLTLVILWAYMSFAQLLIIWMGNTAADTPWYVRRGLGQEANGWRFVGLALVVLHFFVPFLILLSRGAKQNLRRLSRLALCVLILRVVDFYWTVKPSSLEPMVSGLSIRPMDFLMPVALFGIWFAAFVALLRRRPLVMRSMDEDVDVIVDGGGGAHAAH